MLLVLVNGFHQLLPAFDFSSKPNIPNQGGRVGLLQQFGHDIRVETISIVVHLHSFQPILEFDHQGPEAEEVLSQQHCSLVELAQLGTHGIYHHRVFKLHSKSHNETLHETEFWSIYFVQSSIPLGC